MRASPSAGDTHRRHWHTNFFLACSCSRRYSRGAYNSTYAIVTSSSAGMSRSARTISVCPLNETTALGLQL